MTGTDGPTWLNAPPIPDWVRFIIDHVDLDDPETWHLLCPDDDTPTLYDQENES